LHVYNELCTGRRLPVKADRREIQQSAAATMKTFVAVSVATAILTLTGLVACSSTPNASLIGESKVAATRLKVERPASDAPWKTTTGNSFVVPAGANSDHIPTQVA
jgi:hypothetical protein